MKKFKYRAKKGPTETVEGVITAESQDDAIDKINELGLFPVAVDEEGVPRQPRSSTNAPAKTKKSAAKLKHREIITFYRHLAKLIRSGIPILKALGLMIEQTQSPTTRAIFQDIESSIRQGNNLSDALQIYPKVFSPLDLAMIQAGESAGKLDAALGRVIEYREEQAQLRSRVRSALAYPAFILVLGIGAAVFMLTHVIPQFSRFFDDLGQELPFATQVLLKVSAAVRSYGLGAAGMIAAGVIIFKKVTSKNPAKRRWHGYLLKMPRLGVFYTQVEVIRLARTLELLLSSGIPVLSALRIAIPVIQNEALKEDIEKSYRGVQDGRYLSEGLRQSRFFPAFSVQLVSLGEESGKLDESLAELAKWYEQDVTEFTSMLTRFLEPLVILCVGLMLGMMIIAVLMPVFSMDVLIAT